jgi:2-oxoglutarate dehydrogenase E1 component
MEHKAAEKLNNIAIIRIEQLYPFPEAKAKEVLKPYAHVKDIVWCQEESENQGAWHFLQPYLIPLLGKEQKLRYAGRPASASPAAGYHAIHEQEQEKLITQALTK